MWLKKISETENEIIYSFSLRPLFLLLGVMFLFSFLSSIIPIFIYITIILLLVSVGMAMIKNVPIFFRIFFNPKIQKIIWESTKAGWFSGKMNLICKKYPNNPNQN